MKSKTYYIASALLCIAFCEVFSMDGIAVTTIGGYNDWTSFQFGVGGAEKINDYPAAGQY
ncbi:MAG: hypothetical protein GF350_13490 [Chitinivibrionales bacterium]|nr:hypothetical protein [Chitinivibrionales bacterium]